MRWNKGLLIYNGNAGQMDLETKLGACVPVLSPHCRELVILATQEPGEAEQICRENGEDMEVVFILGGDGTVHECINGLSSLEKRPVVGILPGGTCNDFSREIGLPQDIGKTAEIFVSGHTKELDIGKANDRYFSNFLGTGLIAHVSGTIDEDQKNMLGKFSYYLTAFKSVNQVEPFGYRIKYDGSELEGEAVLILVCNGRYLGSAKLPFPNITAEDGMMNIIIVKNTGLAAVKELFFGDHLNGPEEPSESDVVYLQAYEISINTDTEQDIDTDGELNMRTPAEISVLPGHLSFLTGK